MWSDGFTKIDRWNRLRVYIRWTEYVTQGFDYTFLELKYLPHLLCMLNVCVEIECGLPHVLPSPTTLPPLYTNSMQSLLYI